MPIKLFYLNYDSRVSSVHVATQIVTYQLNAFCKKFWVTLCGKNWQKYVAEEFVFHSFVLSELRVKSHFEIITYNF